MLIHDCEQRSPEWWALRVGIPTASEFSRLVTSKGEASKSAETYAIALAAEIYANKPEIDAWQGNQYTERGRALEAQAIALYEFQRDVEVRRVGFVTDDKRTVGCSPDGLVSQDGLIEIKCLKAENHVKAILYHRKHGGCASDFVLQPQGAMMICERQWCDLVFFHPDLPLLVIRQRPDDRLQRALAEQIAFVTRRRDTVLAALRNGDAAGDQVMPSSIPVAASAEEINDMAPVF